MCDSYIFFLIATLHNDFRISYSFHMVGMEILVMIKSQVEEECSDCGARNLFQNHVSFNADVVGGGPVSASTN